MISRRLAVDLGVVTVLAAATFATSGSLFSMDERVIEKIGGLHVWHVELLRWWLAAVVGLAALLVRGRFPLVALAGAGAMALVHLTSRIFSVTPLEIAAPIAMYSVAAAGYRRWVSYAALGAAIGCALLPRLLDIPAPFFGLWRGSWLAVAGAMAVAWLAGDRARTRRLYLEQVTERARNLERERDQQAELAAAAERARIARELHDVVAHGLSIVVIQAQAATGAMERRPATARAALAAIIATGRDSLAEMRRLLGQARPDGPELAPLPGLADLAGLVERVRAAGLPVALRVDGEPAQVPTGIGLSAYRIAQEALTNALKHAGPGATVRVHVHCRPDSVKLTVRDTGRGVGGEPDEARGNGLLGMRERVEMLGGTLAARDAPGGGFEVCADLPVTAQPVGADLVLDQPVAGEA